MFDFAVTGRPIVFFTYDLEDYGGAGAASTSTSMPTRRAAGAAVPHDGQSSGR